MFLARSRSPGIICPALIPSAGSTLEVVRGVSCFLSSWIAHGKAWCFETRLIMSRSVSFVCLEVEILDNHRRG
jgi:hypothetical protein